MAVRLIISKVDGSKDEPLERGFVQDRIVIGRARSCDVCLPDMAVSTRHLEIRLEGSDYKAVDLCSLNGSYVDGKKLVAHRPKVLRNDDVIAVAGFEIRFGLGVLPSGGMGPKEESASQARRMVAALLSRGDQTYPPTLLVTGGPGRAGRFPLEAGGEPLLIGRAREMDIRLEDPDVSRRHARVELVDGRVMVEDLGSRNAIVSGDARVTELVVEPGDSFIVGNTTLTLEHPEDQILSAIQTAPEEDTSSFALRPSSPETFCETKEHPRPEPTLREVKQKASGRAQDALDLPVGPADPLDYPGRPGHMRTTREIPVPQEEEGKSDLGLILVGAIVLAAAVAGLIYLFA